VLGSRAEAGTASSGSAGSPAESSLGLPPALPKESSVTPESQGTAYSCWKGRSLHLLNLPRLSLQLMTFHRSDWHSLGSMHYQGASEPYCSGRSPRSQNSFQKETASESSATGGKDCQADSAERTAKAGSAEDTAVVEIAAAEERSVAGSAVGDSVIVGSVRRAFACSEFGGTETEEGHMEHSAGHSSPGRPHVYPSRVAPGWEAAGRVPVGCRPAYFAFAPSPEDSAARDQTTAGTECSAPTPRAWVAPGCSSDSQSRGSRAPGCCHPRERE